MKNNNLLSIIINGRNDDYNPYFISRLNYVIEHTFYCAKNLNLNNEIQFDICDWGSKKNIRTELRISNDNINNVNFFEVPKNIADNESDRENRFFSFAKSNNVAIRRSKGKFLLLPSHDLIFNQSGMLNLFNILTNKYKTLIDLEKFFLNIERVFLPEKLFNTTPSFEYIEKWISQSYLDALDKHVLNGGAQGGYLTSRNNWFELTGIHEGYDGYGFHEFDLFSRANLDLNWFDSSIFGIRLYKLFRGHAPVREKAKKNLNTQWTSFKKKINSENWGLKNIEITTNKIKQSKNLIETNLELFSKTKKGNTKNLFFHTNNIIKSGLGINTYYKKFIISKTDINNILILNKILSNFRSIRSVLFIGFKDPILPVCVSNINPTLEMYVIDDLKVYLKSLHKDKILNFDKYNNYKGLLFKRLILLSECLMKKNNRQLGYFKPITGSINENLENVLTYLSEENESNLIIIDSSVVNKVNYNNMFNNFDIKNLDKNKINVYLNYKLLEKRDYHNSNIILYSLFFFTNLNLFLINIKKTIRFFYRRIFNKI